MSDNSKHKAVIRVTEQLIKKKSSIQNSKVETFLDVDNDFRLEGQGVGVREDHLVEILYVHYCSTLFFAYSIPLPENEQ